MRNKKPIITESLIHRIIAETINSYINEDGATSCGMCCGATAGATSDSADRQGAFDVPFGGVQRRKTYSPKSDTVSNGMTNVDMSDTLKRHDGKEGSISIPKKKK